MHDEQLEESLRVALRDEGDALPVTITASELERRLALRRRDRLGRRFGVVAAGLGVVLVGSLVATSGIWFGTQSVGSGPSSMPSNAAEPSESGGTCDRIDPAAVDRPPKVGIAVTPGDPTVHPGITTEFRIGDRHVLIDPYGPGPDPITVEQSGHIRVLAMNPAACLMHVSVAYAQSAPDATFPPGSSRPALVIPVSEPTSEVAFDAPSGPGDWWIRVRAVFAADPPTEVWTDTVFRVNVPFKAPGLTLGPDFSEVQAEASCVTYELASGVNSEEPCSAPYTPIEGREPIAVRPGASIDFRLEDDWQIDAVMVRAVDAALVDAGEFAPEYSVDFQEQVGEALSVAIPLDPGNWIMRISLTGSRQGDAFSAHYDLAVIVSDHDVPEFTPPSLRMSSWVDGAERDGVGEQALVGCGYEWSFREVVRTFHCDGPGWPDMTGEPPVFATEGGELRIEMEPPWAFSADVSIVPEFEVGGDEPPSTIRPVDTGEGDFDGLWAAVTFGPGRWVIRLDAHGVDGVNEFNASYFFLLNVGP